MQTFALINLKNVMNIESLGYNATYFFGLNFSAKNFKRRLSNYLSAIDKSDNDG